VIAPKDEQSIWDRLPRRKGGRVTEPAAAPLAALRHSIGLEVFDLSMAELVDAATGLSWTATRSIA
jgi:hypothetical protein